MEEVTLDFRGKVRDCTARAVTKTLEHRKRARPPERFKAWMQRQQGNVGGI